MQLESRLDALQKEALQAAKTAHLRHLSDRTRGITRRRRGAGFIYRDSSGRMVHSREEIDRIHKIAIPPAWREVWICPEPRGHIRATGRDARGRKQYRYHPRWRAVRDANKFEPILRFGRVLPKIRRPVREDLARPGLPREKVLAAVVRLMEMTPARVGNPEYECDNNSFGVTTLKHRHVRISGGKTELNFLAKSSVRHHSVVSDRKLARIKRNCRDLPGSELFQYLAKNGTRQGIDSSDVNDYLREVAGEDISAKDFRTWAATNLAYREFSAVTEKRPSKKTVVEVIKRVAQQLGNTAAVCRKCYLHPVVLSGYLSGTLQGNFDTEAFEKEHPDVWVACELLANHKKTAVTVGGDTVTASRDREYRLVRFPCRRPCDASVGLTSRGGGPISRERVFESLKSLVLHASGTTRTWEVRRATRFNIRRMEKKFGPSKKIVRINSPAVWRAGRPGTKSHSA